MPKHEMAVNAENFEMKGEIITKGRTKQMEAWGRQSAVGHWKVMRGLLPAAVWENW